MIVAGGGIGGLATALAAARTGISVQLLEQAAEFSEVGAGIQLGPNAVRVLQAMGVGPALAQVEARPSQLEVRNAVSAELLGTLPLGDTALSRYGADYLTVARADLQDLLLHAVQSHGTVQLHLNAQLNHVEQNTDAVHVRTANGLALQAHVLAGADGLWSHVRPYVCSASAPRVTGHLAYRAMVPQSQLPVHLRSQVVTAWMGPDFHAVQYPVRSGDWLNIVAIVQGSVNGDATGWDYQANAVDLRNHLKQAGGKLRELLFAVDAWRLWPLFDRPPMACAAEHFKARVALVGDAAHPMRPYLAQGAGMAIEDAAALAQCLSAHSGNVPVALQAFATSRWQRNARVQARAIRNGEIFHLQGPMRWGRDTALKVLGQRLLDVPWLYAGP
jgi:salicylate hydroxylase